MERKKMEPHKRLVDGVSLVFSNFVFNFEVD